MRSRTATKGPSAAAAFCRLIDDRSHCSNLSCPECWAFLCSALPIASGPERTSSPIAALSTERVAIENVGFFASVTPSRVKANFCTSEQRCPQSRESESSPSSMPMSVRAFATHPTRGAPVNRSLGKRWPAAMAMVWGRKAAACCDGQSESSTAGDRAGHGIQRGGGNGHGTNQMEIEGMGGRGSCKIIPPLF